MIALKIAALVFGAGILLEVFSPPDFFPDFFLVIAASLSRPAENPPDFSSDGSRFCPVSRSSVQIRDGFMMWTSC